MNHERAGSRRHVHRLREGHDDTAAAGAQAQATLTNSMASTSFTLNGSVVGQFPFDIFSFGCP